MYFRYQYCNNINWGKQVFAPRPLDRDFVVLLCESIHVSFVHFFSHHPLFNGQGKLNNQQIKLHIREDVKPVMQCERRIPNHVRKEVSKELNKLMEQDIVEKVADQPIPWISPLVATRKKDGSTRIYKDMREANQAMERERHIMPTLLNVQAEMNEAKSFSKTD